MTRQYPPKGTRVIFEFDGPDGRLSNIRSIVRNEFQQVQVAQFLILVAPLVQTLRGGFDPADETLQEPQDPKSLQSC